MDIKRTIQFDNMVKDIDEMKRRQIENDRLISEAMAKLDERLEKLESRKKPGPKPKDIRIDSTGHAH